LPAWEKKLAEALAQADVAHPAGAGCAAFICRMEQVLEDSKRFYESRRPVVGMHEQPKQLLDEARRPIPAVAGRRCRLSGGANPPAFFFADGPTIRETWGILVWHNLE
jgi:hypothetical protein